MAGNLTDRFAATVKQAGTHSDDENLYLKVTPTLKKSWIFKFRFAGKRREMSLGSYPATSLAEARRAAFDANGQVRA